MPKRACRYARFVGWMAPGSRWSETDKKNVLSAARYFCNVYKTVRGQRNKPSVRRFCEFVAVHDSLKNTRGYHIPIIEDKQNWNAGTLKEKVRKDWLLPDSSDYPFGFSEDHLNARDKEALGLVKEAFEDHHTLPLKCLVEDDEDIDKEIEDLVGDLTSEQSVMSSSRTSLGVQPGGSQRLPAQQQSYTLYPMTEAASEQVRANLTAIKKPVPRTRAQRAEMMEAQMLRDLADGTEHQQRLASRDEALKEGRAEAGLQQEVSEGILDAGSSGKIALEIYGNRPYSNLDRHGDPLTENTLDQHEEPLVQCNQQFFQWVKEERIPLFVHRVGAYVVFRVFDTAHFFRYRIDYTLKASDGCARGALVRIVPTVCMAPPVSNTMEPKEQVEVAGEINHYCSSSSTLPMSLIKALCAERTVYSPWSGQWREEFMIPWLSTFVRQVNCECEALYGKKKSVIKYVDYIFSSQSSEDEDDVSRLLD